MCNTKYIVPLFLCLQCTIYSGMSLNVLRIDPLVQTNVGLIRGLAAEDGPYSMFLGIPYATVNSSNPFGPSIPHEEFSETFNAFDDLAMCPQRDEYNLTLVGDIDCLQLSVHVPNSASSTNRLPVMVWIHGGGFIWGYGGKSTQHPRFLMRHDVILVSVNYRLGAYGWLCLNIPEVPGNQGLKDQLTALRWIKNNIEAFGGDSNKITIFGESAGGASVDHHLLYSQENLFSQVIMQSGNALVHFANYRPDPDAALRLAAHLGHETNDIYDALEYLRAVDSLQVIAASEEIDITFRPCVEQEFENVERYVYAHPTEVYLSEDRKKPVMIGFNDNEFGYNFVDHELVDDPFDVLLELRPDIVETFGLIHNIRKFYISDEEIDKDNREVYDNIGNFLSDFSFLHPSYRNIKKYLENGFSPIYHYMFSYAGSRNVYKKKYNVTVGGALHSDELGYLFDTVLFPETPSPEDQLTIARITALWTNFAKYSDPTPEVTDIIPVRWPAVTSEEMHCYVIDSEFSVQKTAFHHRMAFWDLFYEYYGVLLENNES